MNKINDRIVWLNNIVKNNSIEFFLSAFSQIIYLLQTVIQNKIFTNFVLEKPILIIGFFF